VFVLVADVLLVEVVSLLQSSPGSRGGSTPYSLTDKVGSNSCFTFRYLLEDDAQKGKMQDRRAERLFFSVSVSVSTSSSAAAETSGRVLARPSFSPAATTAVEYTYSHISQVVADQWQSNVHFGHSFAERRLVTEVYEEDDDDKICTVSVGSWRG
jgi:hypothetical protein